MMKKKTSITIGTILLLIAVIFIGVAVSHPEFSFPWILRITYMLYGLYVWLLFRFLLIIPVFPVWLTMIFLNITGMIYKYDYSMDEGTAVIIGIFLLALWLFVVLLPIVEFLRYAYSLNKKNLWICINNCSCKISSKYLHSFMVIVVYYSGNYRFLQLCNDGVYFGRTSGIVSK